jgi:pyridoxal phosphate enzyme (YggS family)
MERLGHVHGRGTLTLDPAIVRDGYASARAAVDEAAVRAGRRAEDVEILAAVKYVGADDLPALAAAGIRRVGENKTEALLAKQAEYGDLFTWDFIGHLQSRKAKDVVGRVCLIHSLESESAAAQIERRAETPQDVLLEVNVANDPTKDGILTDGIDPFLEHLAGFGRIRVRGLMTMPPFADDPESSRPSFARLRELAEACATRWAPSHTFSVLSMGTSQDYTVAVEEGATIVRLGGVLYGR